jgi:hypothetical protein
VAIIRILIGILLLLYGRTLYWAFVAVAGFLVGFELGEEFFAKLAESVRVLIAILTGILGAALGMLAQRVAFAIGGLFAGGYLALILSHAARLPGEPIVWVVIGAILGAIIAALVMDWAIIVLSSLAGAAAIVGELNLSDSLVTLVFIALSVIGVMVQGRRLRYAAYGPPAAIE